MAPIGLGDATSPSAGLSGRERRGWLPFNEAGATDHARLPPPQLGIPEAEPELLSPGRILENRLISLPLNEPR